MSNKTYSLPPNAAQMLGLLGHAGPPSKLTPQQAFGPVHGASKPVERPMTSCPVCVWGRHAKGILHLFVPVSEVVAGQNYICLECHTRYDYAVPFIGQKDAYSPGDTLPIPIYPNCPGGKPMTPLGSLTNNGAGIGEIYACRNHACNCKTTDKGAYPPLPGTKVHEGVDADVVYPEPGDRVYNQLWEDVAGVIGRVSSARHLGLRAYENPKSRQFLTHTVLVYRNGDRRQSLAKVYLAEDDGRVNVKTENPGGQYSEATLTLDKERKGWMIPV